MCVNINTCFFVSCSDPALEKTHVNTEKSISGKLVISVPYEGQISFWAQKFEKEYPDCQVEVESADSIQDINAYVQKMTLEIMGGSGADIYDSGWLSYYKYTKSGAFQNLRNFMENDVDFDMSDYYENIVNAYEYNEEIIALPTNFTYPALRINKNLLGEKAQDLPETLNYKELYELYDTVIKDNPNEKISFAIPGSTGRIIFDQCEYGKYMDLKKLEVRFNTPEFISYLDDMKKYDFGASSDEPTIADRIDFDDKECFSNFYSVNMDYGNDETETATRQILLNATDGKNVFMEIGNLLSISKSSQNPELAWEFIKFVIEEKPFEEDGLFDAQSENYYKNVDPCITYMPINKKNFEKRAQYFAQSESVANFWSKTNSSLSRVAFNDYQLNTVLSEINDEYDKGLITEEECAKKLQERAEIYLSE